MRVIVYSNDGFPHNATKYEICIATNLLPFFDELFSPGISSTHKVEARTGVDIWRRRILQSLSIYVVYYFCNYKECVKPALKTFRLAWAKATRFTVSSI